MPLAIEFDFATKREREIALADACASCRDGRYCWVDFDGPGVTAAAPFLHSMGLDDLTVETLLEDDERPRFNVFPSCLHFTLREGRFVDGEFRAIGVEVILGPQFLATVHREPAEFLRKTRETYREDFYEHSQTPSFLLFELADHLTHVCRDTLTTMAEKIEAIEVQLFGDPGDEIFLAVSDLIRDLLEFRKMIISAREVFHELATRRSPFISEHTQPFLEKKAVLLERLSADATIEREVLSESLHLYMGMVTYRSNKVLSRLTVISIIFLPLTFLVGVYGMNFGAAESTMPEIRWRYGYLAFWVVVVTLVGALLVFMRRKKWL
ncbi:MAG TPA: magnesium transporter CorA family protein [Planctomycetaceae bacterium]|nr:magnesium transporter CorA family protein [Planctomycetaceae bacterium]